METKSALDALAGLAQETRLAIFRLLVEAGPEGLPVGTIAEKLALPAATLSFHLAHLHRAGLVIHRRTGRTRLQSANYQTIIELVGYLTENCCGGETDRCIPIVTANPGNTRHDGETVTHARQRR